MSTEQADGHGKHAKDGHAYLKQQKRRLDRREAKASLRKGEQPQDKTKKYGGYET